MSSEAPFSPSEGDVLLLVGTMKGAFVFSSGPDRREWRMEGPHFRGQAVYAMAFDQRGGRRRILASSQSMHWGSVVRTSDDFGATWSAPDRQNVRFPEGSDLALANIWQLRPGRADEPDVLYAGVEPAALFESRDAGESWSVVDGLLNHEHRPQWQPGGGGLCLHTIVVDPADPRRMGVAISTGGFYRTDDGGESWRPRNVGVRAEFLPDKYPEFGQCVHKVVHHPSRPERLFLQNHWGLYRSDDWGDTWHDIANGVPSDFGFAMEVHPRQPDTVYIVPLESDEFRVVPEARLRVYRTRDAGESWQPLGEGLPQEDAFETVLRDGMTTDGGDPAGIYFGTRLGKLFGSADAGDTWMEIADALPPVVCVKAAVVGDGGSGS
ncbi:MAG TPA: hypothetical protein VFR37_05660 [Longimicrobium sp.]|nr:hypothetical protein [Longimicrobium sp.]